MVFLILCGQAAAHLDRSYASHHTLFQHAGSTGAVSALLLGGTGALGSLAAAWLWSNPLATLTALGRTGRGSLPGLESAAGCVTISSCDAATRQDAAGMVQRLRQNGDSLPGERDDESKQGHIDTVI